ncbi:hypothetical protein RIR_e31847_A0A2N0PXU0_9GLOM [Rhizophagus irregularis DAOM 181602=DAOM 197198]|nr:hypothetical protein RIR_e31847_A0A2N0PXU0_9GLOM [Rhizophagus irregularis DAOM 181602=DAOM 197198]
MKDPVTDIDEHILANSSSFISCSRNYCNIRLIYFISLFFFSYSHPHSIYIYMD